MLRFFTDILLPKQVKTIQKLVHGVTNLLPFYLRCCLAHLSFAVFPPVSEKREKIYTLSSTHDFALGFWVGTHGRVAALPSFF